MERVIIIGLALLGIASKMGPSPPPVVEWLSWFVFAAVMFLLGVRLDDALCRWAMKPHWKRQAPSRSKDLRAY